MVKLASVNRAIGFGFIGFVVALLVWPCAPLDYVLFWQFWEVGREEVMRATSPDGVVDAVLIEANPGAMSSYHYLLYLVPKGKEVGKGDTAVFHAKRLLYPHYSWERPHHFIIEYREAHILWFSNLWASPEVWESNYAVELRLVPSVPGPHYLTEEGNLRQR